jgi:terminase small subunit-like protein
MPRPGPTRKPSAIAALQGGAKTSHRPVNTDEPKPEPVKDLKAPRRQVSAETIWSEIAPELQRLNLLSILDPRRLLRACRVEAMGLRLLAIAEKDPFTDSKANGRQVNPALDRALRCFDTADKVWEDFGIGSPADRAGLHAPQPKGITAGEGPAPPKDPHDELARRRQARQGGA